MADKENHRIKYLEELIDIQNTQLCRLQAMYAELKEREHANT